LNTGVTDDDHGQANSVGVKRYTVHQSGATPTDSTGGIMERELTDRRRGLWQAVVVLLICSGLASLILAIVTGYRRGGVFYPIYVAAAAYFALSGLLARPDERLPEERKSTYPGLYRHTAAALLVWFIIMATVGFWPGLDFFSFVPIVFMGVYAMLRGELESRHKKGRL